MGSNQRHGHPARDGRASFLAHQGLDGSNALPVQRPKAVRTEMSLRVLAYNLQRIMAAIGVARLRKALAT
jgi:hypothetical protein